MGFSIFFKIFMKTFLKRWRPFFIFLFCGDHLNSDRKTISISMQTFFFWDHLNLEWRNRFIWVKANKNLGQDCLMLLPVSKTAPPPMQNSWLRACQSIPVDPTGFHLCCSLVTGSKNKICLGLSPAVFRSRPGLRLSDLKFLWFFNLVLFHLLF